MKLYEEIEETIIIPISILNKREDITNFKMTQIYGYQENIPLTYKSQKKHI